MSTDLYVARFSIGTKIAAHKGNGKKKNNVVTMTMKSMKYSDCDTIMDGYNPVPPPLPRRVPPVRNIYAEPFATETNTAR